jgi:hypothetical protein
MDGVDELVEVPDPLLEQVADGLQTTVGSHFT